MKKLTIILSLTVMALFCCQCATSSQYRQAKKGAKSIQFQTLENYYVRNDVKHDKLQRYIFDNQEDFDAVFGPAPLMGGLPTDINWKRQYVVAVLLPETNRPTMVTPMEVKQSPGNIIFYYQVNRGRKTSYTLVPFAAVALDRTVDPQQLQVFYIEK